MLNLIPKIPTSNSTTINVLSRFALKYFEIYDPTPLQIDILQLLLRIVLLNRLVNS